MNGTAGCRWRGAHECTLLRLTTKSSPSPDSQMPNNLRSHPSRQNLLFRSVPESTKKTENQYIILTKYIVVTSFQRKHISIEKEYIVPSPTTYY